MAPPSSRPPRGPDNNPPDAPRRNDRTVFEYRPQPARPEPSGAPPQPPKVEPDREKRTLFGFARAALGSHVKTTQPAGSPSPSAAAVTRDAPVHPAPSGPAVSVGRVAGVGAPSAPPPARDHGSLPVRGPTVPHYNVQHRPRAPVPPPPGGGREVPTMPVDQVGHEPAAMPHAPSYDGSGYAQPSHAPSSSYPPSPPPMGPGVAYPPHAHGASAPSGASPPYGSSPPYGQAPAYGSAPSHGSSPHAGSSPPYGSAPSYGSNPRHSPSSPYGSAPGSAAAVPYGAPPHDASKPSPYAPPPLAPSEQPGPAATAFVDVRAIAAADVPMPEVRRGEKDTVEDPLAFYRAMQQQQPPQQQITQPDVPRVREDRPAFPSDSPRFPVRQVDSDAIDVNQVLGRVNSRKLMLGGASFVVALLTALSFFAGNESEKSEPLARPTHTIPANEKTTGAGAPAEVEARVPRARVKENEREPEPRAVADDRDRRVAEREPRESDRQSEREHGRRSHSDSRRSKHRDQERAREDERASEREAEREREVEAAPAQAERAADDRAEASPERAAVLYIEGKYKQALSEYRLLSTAHPREKVYREFARILKRKIIDTCLRAQPNRREQCREI